MKVSGAGTVGAPHETVWAAMADRDLLLRSMPGLDCLDFPGPGRCRFTVRVTIAAVAGSYGGEAALQETDGRTRLMLRVSAAGDKGTIAADVTLRLAPGGDGATEVSYEADAEVSGPVAGIGERWLVSIARRLAGDFIAGLDRVLSAPSAAPSAAPPSGLPAATRPADQTAPMVEQPADPLSESPHKLMVRSERADSAVRTGLLAGAAAGLGGLLIGVMLGRRSRNQLHGRR